MLILILHVNKDFSLPTDATVACRCPKYIESSYSLHSICQAYNIVPRINFAFSTIFVLYWPHHQMGSINDLYTYQ